MQKVVLCSNNFPSTIADQTEISYQVTVCRKIYDMYGMYLSSMRWDMYRIKYEWICWKWW